MVRVPIKKMVHVYHLVPMVHVYHLVHVTMVKLYVYVRYQWYTHTILMVQIWYYWYGTACGIAHQMVPWYMCTMVSCTMVRSTRVQAMQALVRVQAHMLARIVVEVRAADIAVELEPQL